jgi:hypothetical protein
MRQQRRNSLALTKAERRVEGLQTINPDLDFGNRLIRECEILTTQ